MCRGGRAVLWLIRLIPLCLSYQSPRTQSLNRQVSLCRWKTRLSNEPSQSASVVPDAPSVMRLGHCAHVQPKVWDQWLVPKREFRWSGTRGVDETVHWSSTTVDAAAHDLLQRTLPVTTPESIRHDMHQSIVTSMQSFQSCLEQRILNHAPEQVCSARLVSSRGTVGAKCPLWHVDSVSYRWIQALAGPGCLWVANPQAVNWDHWRGRRAEPHTMSNEKRNQQIIDARRAVIVQAHEGEGVVLLGNKGSPQSYPAVHKSPEIRAPWQGRVLLTLNVVDQG